METVYGMLTKGVIESRKSFLYGPFCIVYGIAALCLVYPLKKYKGKNEELFIYGMVIGCMVEYFSSLIAELIFHIKWWDYSNDFLNINGRTCIFYALIWGILSIVLINYVHPVIEKKVDNIINNYFKVVKFLTSVTAIFILFDMFATSLALNNFMVRVNNNYNIATGINKNKKEGKMFNVSNQEIMLNYPNICVEDKKLGTILYLDEIVGDNQNYYFKLNND